MVGWFHGISENEWINKGINKWMVGWLEWETKEDKWMNDYVNGWLVERMVLGGWMDE